MDKLIVIGSNSFSGASFVDHALARGVEVVGISRSDEPHPAFLPWGWQARPGRYRFERLDLNRDLSGIMAVVDAFKPTWIVNFAAQSMVAESWRNPGDWFMTNAVSTVRFHDELRRRPWLTRYVHVSTPEVYGNCAGFVGEDHPFNPSTPYAVSRAAADMSLRTFHAAYGFPVVITRAANVYGPGQQLYRIIPRTILFMLMGRTLQLHGGGVSTRSFIHIRDVAEATWRIMKDGRNGETYHISTNEVISIRALVEKLCEKLGVPFERQVEVVGERLGKDAAYHLDSGKLRRELAWRDEIGLDAGLDECIDWVRRYFDVLRQAPLDYIHKP